ncbi:keratin, type I cytoskeletal 10-like [Impatiens glandulifera]|uniref:keratin, type I cytoskeletal 10-like n=1 Tax=Impatiens glandulifera TaxID=253017 RepID=UPI001FB11275|nr:keratin, type I cytoskeletal 10-like [Impatiens glandulifera]
MDLSDDRNVDEDEQVVALLIEIGSFSVEEKRLMAQPQASLEKEAEVSQPDVARSEGEPSKDKESKKSSSSEGEQAKNDESSKRLPLSQCLIPGSPKSQPFPSITTANIHDNILNPYHHSRDFSDKVHKTAPANSHEISSNEGSSASDGTKLMKSMKALMATLQKNMAVMESNMVKIMKTQKSNKKKFADLLKTHNEMEQTLKKNTYEVHIVNKSYTKFEKNFFKWKSEFLDCERENNVEMHNEVMDGMSLLRDELVQAEEDAKVVAEKEKNLITQGEDNRGRRGGGVSIGTRSKRKSTSDNSDRPIKRGGGRSGDRGGRSSRGDRGGRSGGTGRGGRSFPPFHNLLTGEEMSDEGFNYPIDPLIKREEQ